jgi:hypothetical protein
MHDLNWIKTRCKNKNFVIFGLCLGSCLLVSVLLPRFSWSMGTPPFDADVRTVLSPTTKQLLQEKGCFSVNDTIEASSRYRNLKSRKPIADKKITASLSFPGRDSKGSRLITLSYTQTTNTEGEAVFSIAMSQALADAKKALQQDRFYRGVKRVRGRINLSFSSEDTFTKSIRYVPARGVNFRLCRPGAVDE